MSLIKENERELLIKTFILSVTLSELISYGVKLNILPEMFHATRYEPVPFIHHVQYSPFVAFSSFLLMYYFLFVKSSKRAKAIEVFFIITMCINLFLTGGRAGQVVYFFLLIYTFFYLFKFSFKSILAVMIIIPLLFGIFYSFGGIFKERVNMAIYNTLHFNKNKNTSIGERLVFWQNTIHLAKQKPILGYGTGSFKKIYGNYSKKVTPNIRIPAQPHNMYLFIFFQTGIIGLSVFLYLFYKMFEYGLKINDRYKFIRLGFVGYFLIIMLSDSYLFSHFHQSLFVIFTAVLYKRLNYE
jgi:O-antigen ligase